jgi:hypothetical protein
MKYCVASFLLFFLIYSSSAQTPNDTLKFVTYRQLLSELEKIAQNTLEPSKILQDEFAQLKKTHGIAADTKNYRDFVRVRLAFEATRDSGLWQIRWAITNNKPNSDAIWRQWQKQTIPKFESEETAQETAIAECDELSALFAFVARGLGVKKVGLFWPTWNHTVAVWTSIDKFGKPVRIVVPTSQIFISANATLGTKEFDPNKQKTIYDYSRKDVALTYKIPAPLARMMITQVKKFGGKSAAFLQARRNRLSKKFGGS